jgi:hypothetical protein
MRTGTLTVVPARRDRPTLVDQVCQGWPDAPVPVLQALQGADDALARVARAAGLDSATPPGEVAAVVESVLDAALGNHRG